MKQRLLSRVADGAEDLCDFIDSADSDTLDKLVDVSQSYLTDMIRFQEQIASQPQSDDEKQISRVDRDAFIDKMLNRFNQLNGPLQSLKSLNLLDDSFSTEKVGLETVGDFVNPDQTYFFEGQYVPNPMTFLPKIFENFPELFNSNTLVADVHGDGQASNLMYDPSEQNLFKWMFEKGTLATPHGE